MSIADTQPNKGKNYVCCNGMMIGERSWTPFNAASPEEAAIQYAETFPDEEPDGIFRVHVKAFGQHDTEYEPYQVTLANMRNPFTDILNERTTARKL